VDFHGIEVGEVVSLDVEYDRDARTLRFPVEIHIYPERMRSRYRAGTRKPGAEEGFQRRLLDRLVARGLRAQLKNGNLLTGQLFVSMDFMAGAKPASVDWSKRPAVIPTVRSKLDELQATLSQIARNLEKVPFEALAGDARRTLQALQGTLRNTDELVGDLREDIAPELRATLEEARSTLAGARSALGNAEQALTPGSTLRADLGETLQELTRAAQALRTLADYLERHPESLLRGRRDSQPQPQRAP
jgi:paraquat-inducible protein B